MKKFDIPAHYASSIIGKVKAKRKAEDPRKQDFSPTTLDFGSVKFIIARHFGFCYGVENAIEKSYKAIQENPDKNIYLISQMIHNPMVNQDLVDQGIRFLQDTSGNQLIDWDVLTKNDIVIIPAFGTTVETQEKLMEIGVNISSYNTTCPFVEKVWNRAEKLGETNHTIIIHGKANHEETKATFSHSKENAHSIVIKDINEAKQLGAFILGESSEMAFMEKFKSHCSIGFNPSTDLTKIGVVNQTTMLASETQEIAEYFKNVMLKKYGEEKLKEHFADTRDTLCYATNDNQSSTYELLKCDADLAIVIGGYNSSNTSHLVELLDTKFLTYYIKNESEIISRSEINHFNIHSHSMELVSNFIPKKEQLNIIITSGASCPDVEVDRVIQKLHDMLNATIPLSETTI